MSSIRSYRYIEVPSATLESIGAVQPEVEAEDEFGFTGLTTEERERRFAIILNIAETEFTDRQLQIFVMRYFFQMKGQQIANCLRCKGSEKIKRKKFSDPAEFAKLAEQFKDDETYSVTQPYIAFVLRDLVTKLRKSLKVRGEVVL